MPTERPPYILISGRDPKEFAVEVCAALRSGYVLCGSLCVANEDETYYRTFYQALILDHPAEPTVGAWEPIATAPIDQTSPLDGSPMSELLLLGHPDYSRAVLGRFDVGRWEDIEDERSLYLQPTHWRRLPALPTARKDGP